MNMKTTAIAPWYGSNRMLAEHVGKALEGCKWVGVPFAGGMCELAHIKARSLIVNDKHFHVINLASVVAGERSNAKLYRHLRRLPFHPVTLLSAQMRCREREATFTSGDGPSALASIGDFQWAADYFTCAWMSRNGEAGKAKEFDAGMSIRWDAGGGDSATRFRSATSSLVAWRKVLTRANFTTIDAFEFIEKVKDADGHGLYCDPPFPGPGDLYKNTFGEEGQRRLAKMMSWFTKTRVVMRFYDHPLIRELYPESRWEWQRRTGRKSSNADAAEVLLVSTPAPSATGAGAEGTREGDK